MQKSEQMQKRPYSKPKIVMVQLNHEQAVLSQCSGSTLSLSTSNPRRCYADPSGCRQSAGPGFDSSAGS